METPRRQGLQRKAKKRGMSARDIAQLPLHYVNLVLLITMIYAVVVSIWQAVVR